MICPWHRRQRESDEKSTRYARMDTERRLKEIEANRPRVERVGDQLSYLIDQALRGGT